MILVTLQNLGGNLSDLVCAELVHALLEVALRPPFEEVCVLLLGLGLS